MDKYTIVQNFIFSIGSLIGVYYLYNGFTRAAALAKDKPSSRNDTGARIFTTLALATALLSLSVYIDMGTQTVYGSRSFSVLSEDPWLSDNNIANTIANISGLPTKDTQAFASVVTTFIKILKLGGLLLFMYGIILWIKMQDGKEDQSIGRVVSCLIVGALFFNPGHLIRLAGNAFGYEIEI